MLRTTKIALIKGKNRKYFPNSFHLDRHKSIFGTETEMSRLLAATLGWVNLVKEY